MKEGIHEYDVVALLEDAPARHIITDRPIVLKRGLVGTVVMLHGDDVVEVEFAGDNGHAEALLPLPVSKLMALSYTPLVAV